MIPRLRPPTEPEIEACLLRLEEPVSPHGTRCVRCWQPVREPESGRLQLPVLCAACALLPREA